MTDFKLSGNLSFLLQIHLSCMFHVMLLTMLIILVYLLGSFCLLRGGRSGVGARLRKLFLCSSASKPSPTMQSKFSELTSPLTALFCWLYRSLFLHRLFLSVTLSILCILYYYNISILILSYRQLLCSQPGLEISRLDNKRILFFMFVFYLETNFQP